MGGLFKPSSSTTRSTQTTNPYTSTWGMVEPGFQSIMNQLNQTGPMYGNQLTANWSQGQQSALDTARSFLDSNNLTSRTARGDFLDITKNPSYSVAMKDLNNQFGRATNSLNTKFAPWANSSMRQNAAGGLMQSWGEGANKIAADMYNTEMNRALNAQNQLANYNQSVSNLESAKLSNQQSGLDAQYKEWLRGQGVSENSINNFLQAAALLRSPSTDSLQKTSQKSSFLGK